MPSFSFTNPSSSSSIGSSLGSMHKTIIAYARWLLPPSFNDFIPFLLAGLTALLFTALLVLLVEDSEDAYPHTHTQLANSQSTSGLRKDKKRKGRLVGLAEQDSDAAERGTDDEEWAWDPRADHSNSDDDMKMSMEWTRVQKEKMALSGYRYRTTNPRLLASPPPSASPQSPAFTPPMLSMAKLIMHRHDQSSKRARAASSRPSPPPSPPACTAGGSGSGAFGTMQYTLKAAAIKDTKKVLVAFPSSEDSDSDSVSPSSSTSNSPSNSPLSPVFPHQSTPTSDVVAQPTDISISRPPSPTIDIPPNSPSPSSTTPTTPKPIPTRHARSRSIAQLPSLQLPSTNHRMNIPELVPALQLLETQPERPAPRPKQQPSHPKRQGSIERTIRRRPSSMLEEGGVPAQSVEPVHSRDDVNPTLSPSKKASSRSKERRSRKRSGSCGKASAQQGLERGTEVVPEDPRLPNAYFPRVVSEGLSALEEGSR